MNSLGEKSLPERGELPIPRYGIMPVQVLPADLRAFGGAMVLSSDFTGSDGEVYRSGEVMLSENIPERFRPYFALHEACCVPHAGEKDHCKNATKQELLRVPCEIRADYIQFRKGFLLGLIRYFESSIQEGIASGIRNQRSEQFLPEVQSSLQYLESLGECETLVGKTVQCAVDTLKSVSS